MSPCPARRPCGEGPIKFEIPDENRCRDVVQCGMSDIPVKSINLHWCIDVEVLHCDIEYESNRIRCALHIKTNLWRNQLNRGNRIILQIVLPCRLPFIRVSLNFRPPIQRFTL